MKKFLLPALALFATVVVLGSLAIGNKPEAPIETQAPIPAPRVVEAPVPATPKVVEDLDADGIPDDRDHEVLLPDGSLCQPTASIRHPGPITMHVSSTAAHFDQTTTIEGVVHGSQTCYKMSFPEIPLPDGGNLTP